MTEPEHAGHGYSADKDALARRLSRIEGQVRGVARMVAEDRYCIDVLTQISAVQAALDKVAMNLLADHVRHCVTYASGDDADEKAAELVDTVARITRR